MIQLCLFDISRSDVIRKNLRIFDPDRRNQKHFYPKQAILRSPTLDRPKFPSAKMIRNTPATKSVRHETCRCINITSPVRISEGTEKGVQGICMFRWYHLLKFRYKFPKNKMDRVKRIWTPFPLGFNDNIYHEGNISKMPDFDVFSLLEIRKRKSRSHGIRKKGNGKRKKRAVKRSNTSLKDLSKVLEDHGRHSMLSFLSSLPISVLRILDTEANKFYDRNHQLYDAALLTRCYTQHALRLFIDSEINRKRHFIKIPFINKGIEFIDLPSIFKYL